jgi:hypothetical protein
MTAAAPGDNTCRIRKGDLILVERVDRDYYTDGFGVIERTSYEFGVVAAATRDGVAKTWCGVGWGDNLISDGYAQPVASRSISRHWVLSAKEIEVEGVLRAAKAHHWPNHPDQPMPFASLDDAKAAARPHVIQPTADIR